MNLLSIFRISPKESCPCGSGKIYRDCCRGKNVKTPHSSKEPVDVQIMKMMRKSLKKCCLHPDQAACKGKIKEAHALQNNKIISLLAGSDRHVYVMDAKRQPLIIPIKKDEPEVLVQIARVSANKATTETCFCDLHDNIAFAAIEKGAPDFDENNEEMKFVYAYKVFIFEYYKQVTALDVFKECFKNNPQAFVTPSMIGMYRMLRLKMNEFEPIKSYFDSEVLSNGHSGLITCVIRIPEQIKFANYAYIAPDYDMNGNRIKHTKKGVMHRIAITIFPEKTQSYILLSCLATEKNIYAKLFEQLKQSSIDKVKFYFSMLLPLYSENIVLSPKLWENWSEDVQAAYTFYSNINGYRARVYGRAIGMGLKNAYKAKSDYSKRGKIDLFI